MVDTPHYVPNPPPLLSDQEDRELADWIYRELQTLARSFQNFRALDLQATYVAPTRPRNGMIVYADGTQWNPGAGEGHYGYINGVWTKLFP